MAVPVRTLRIEDDTWSRWKKMADARGLTMTALVREAMESLGGKKATVSASKPKPKPQTRPKQKTSAVLDPSRPLAVKDVTPRFKSEKKK